MVTDLKKKNSKLLGFLIIFVIVFLNAIGPYLQLQQIATLGLIPLLSAIAFFKDFNGPKNSNKEFIFFTMILATGLLTIFYYRGYDEFIRNFSLLFGTVLSTYIVIVFTKKDSYVNYFHIGYILTILCLFIIMILRGSISNNFASALDFRNRFLHNANTYSYFCIFANFSLFYLYLQNKKKITLILLIILPILFLVIAFTTQSRAGLVLLIFINIFFWFFVNKNDTVNTFKKLLSKILLIIVFIFLTVKFIDVYDGSRISRRVEQTTQRKDSRELLFWEGIETFKKNPILGVGLGQFPLYSKYKLFTHNSYSEILAEQGLIGAVFLFLLYLKPSIKSIRNIRLQPSNPFLRCNVLFFTTFLIYNNAYVIYKFPFSMMYFFLIISIQKNYIVNDSPKDSIDLKY